MKLICWSNKTTVADCCATSARAWYLRFSGEDALPMCLQDPNSITKNLFEYIELPLPQLSTAPDVEHSLTLINHNQEKDSIAERNNYTLDGIIDIHPLVLNLQESIMVRTAQVWSVATLVAEIFLEQVYVPTKEEATLLIVAIVDDTAMLTKDSTTERDHQAADRLNELAWIEDLKWFIAALQK